GEAGGVEVGHRADRRMAIGMADREQRVADLVFDEAVRLVVALPLLVLHHTALLIELVLGHGTEQVAHAVAFHEQREVERAGRHGFDVVRAIVPGRSVGAGRAGGFERNVEVGHVLAAAEHQVLEQVREAGAAARFVLGADAVVDRDAHHGRLAVGVDNGGQAIGEGEGLVGDVDFGNERGERRRFRGSGGGGSLGDRRAGYERERRDKSERGGERSGEAARELHRHRIARRRRNDSGRVGPSSTRDRGSRPERCLLRGSAAASKLPPFNQELSMPRLSISRIPLFALALALCPPGLAHAQSLAGSGVAPGTEASSAPRPIEFASVAPADAALVIVMPSTALPDGLPLSAAERDAVTAAIAAEGFEGKANSSLSLRGIGTRPRLLVVGVGDEAQGVDVAKAAGKAAQELKGEEAPVAITGLPTAEAV